MLKSGEDIKQDSASLSIWLVLFWYTKQQATVESVEFGAEFLLQ